MDRMEAMDIAFRFAVLCFFVFGTIAALVPVY